jgi:hypothetical protein
MTLAYHHVLRMTFNKEIILELQFLKPSLDLIKTNRKKILKKNFERSNFSKIEIEIFSSI